MNRAVTVLPSRFPWRAATRRACSLLLAAGLCVAVACQPGATKLPELGRLPDYRLTDQAGKPYGAQELRGAPYLAAFMFTRCPTICPRVSARLKEIEVATERKGHALHFVSISVDGEHDSPEELSRYAHKHGLVGARHILLTGNSQFVAAVAEKNFKIAAEGHFNPSEEHQGIRHGSHLVLVDGTGTIRGYYRSSDAETTDKLLADLGHL